ncbi:hypothetical protein [Synechococcus sp. BA-132 BA5]|uniref:hypothetical protein n=1 Tax=Synechococcus sp. BA-132 BA5 TaxID=3110252 RepID=UPI002B20831A|nr:hypothetical protein [Synechococcus sp. BA-132 BA5]MEA5414694.1 hypothetical protein [Synechococcus sp. BA-132 BA5]
MRRVDGAPCAASVPSANTHLAALVDAVSAQRLVPATVEPSSSMALRHVVAMTSPPGALLTMSAGSASARQTAQAAKQDALAALPRLLSPARP